jgi:glycosyltransferase involved in cell wall biosynthesis
MRILVCHSRYRSGAASGENRVANDEVRLLNEAGHQVVSYMPSAHPKGKSDLLRLGMMALWNSSAITRLDTLLRMHRPDVVHFHNLFPMLSPASLRLPRTDSPAIVMTLHNYRLLCLPGTLLRNGRICELCLGTLPWRGVLFRCYHRSVAASGVLALSVSINRAIRSFERVNRYIAISEFVRQKHLEAGFPKDQIGVKPHFAWPSERRDGPGRYFLFLGRLSEEKGAETLLRAWSSDTGTLIVAGGGPEEQRLRAMARGNVEFRGVVSEQESARLIRGARSLIVPSICYEGAGRVVMEAYAAGVPVIASDIGGLPEAVCHDVSGLLVAPADVQSLAQAIERLGEDEESERLGEGAWRMWNENYSPEQALSNSEQSYQLAIRARDGQTDEDVASI